MTGFGTPPQTSLRRRVAALAASAILAPLGAVSLLVPAASAATLSALSTNFEIDGNDAGTWDWEGVLAGNATTFAPYPAGTPTSSGIIDETHLVEACALGSVTSGDTRFTPGTKLDDLVWTIADGGPDKNDDLCRATAAYEVVNFDGQYHTILYLSWDRSYTATGQAQLYLMLNDGGGRKHLVNFHFNPSSGLIEVLLYTWDGSTWAPGATLDYQAAYGRTRLVPSGVTANDGTFGEVAVDLTSSGLLPEASCTSLTTGWALSRNGNENSQAGLADVVQPAPLTLSTCQQLSVTKTTTGAVPSDLLFDYQVRQADEHSIGQVSPAADAVGWSTNLTPLGTPTYAVGAANDPEGIVSITSALRSGETHTYSNVIAEPDYIVAELTGDLPDGVRLRNLSCTTYDVITGAEVTVDLVVDGVPVKGATFPIAAASIPGSIPAACTIENQVTSLTLNKIVVNNSGGTATGADFPLTAMSGEATILSGPDPAPNDPATGLSALVAGGTYALSEATGPKGYAASEWTCVVTDAAGATSTTTGASVTLPEFGSADCTITNDDPPSLAWTKIDSLTGQKLGGTSWILTISGSALGLLVTDCAAAPCASYDTDPDAGEFLVLGLSQGVYTVVESEAPAGYRLNTTTYTVTIDSNGAFVLTPAIPNVPTAVGWHKVGADGQPLAGTTWEIRPVGEGEPTTVTDCTAAPCTGADTDPVAGSFLVRYLVPGSYVLVETGVPAGYYLDPTERPFTVDATVQDTIPVTEGAITNTLVRAVWTKVDEFDSELLLGGSEWTLTGPDDQVITVTDCVAATAADCPGPDLDPMAGAFAVDGLAPGDWTLEETKAPVGYLVIAEPVTLTISATQAVFDFGVIENYENGQISWMKTDDAGAALGGATFEVCEAMEEGYCFLVEDNIGQDGYDGWDTDPRPGHFVVADLIFGNYTVTEAEAPEGYLLDESVKPVTVTATADPIPVGTFIDIKKTYGLTLTKSAYEGMSPSDGTVDFGDTVTYRLTVTAGGNSPSTHVTVTDALPAGVTYIADSATCLGEVSPCSASYDSSTRTITWVVDEMANGSSVLLVFDVTVDAAPHVEPGTTYTWTADNMGAAMSDQTPKVPSNIVTIKASKTVLPETGGNTLPLILGGILAILTGGVLVLAGRRRNTSTE